MYISKYPRISQTNGLTVIYITNIFSSLCGINDKNLGISVKKCGLNDVFPHEDLSSAPQAQSLLICILYIMIASYVLKMKSFYRANTYQQLILPLQWVSCRMHKIAGCTCAGYAGNVFPLDVSVVGLSLRILDWTEYDRTPLCQICTLNCSILQVEF